MVAIFVKLVTCIKEQEVQINLTLITYRSCQFHEVEKLLENCGHQTEIVVRQQGSDMRFVVLGRKDNVLVYNSRHSVNLNYMKNQCLYNTFSSKIRCPMMSVR